MNISYVSASPLKFLTLYTVLITLIYTISFNLLIKDFRDLESKQNSNNIKTFINKIDSELKSIHSIVNDYAKWDLTYEFIKTKNKDYIFENFREDSNTLYDLNLDFMAFVNRENQKIYSDYNSSSILHRDSFEKSLIKYLENSEQTTLLYRYNKRVFFLVKSQILKSDFSGEKRGYILSGREIDKESLSNLSSIFKDIKIDFDYKTLKSKKEELEFLKRVEVSTKFVNKEVENRFDIFDDSGSFSFSFLASNEMEIYTKGEQTIFILNVILDLILLILLYIIYQNQTLIQRYNNILVHKVTTRTNQLKESLKRLQVRNCELDKLANFDSLTNIKNRRAFFEDSEEYLKNIDKKSADFSILILDIDHFKSINDTYGHAVGDEVLVRFCEVINSVIDKNAIFARVGGEEFCISFRDTSFEDAIDISNKIREEIESYKLKIDGMEICFTVSLGLCKYTNQTSIDEILLCADRYLYKAKNSGRNQLIFEL